MNKYRILEVPQPDGSNKYRINICVLKAKSDFWLMKKPEDRIIETWHSLDQYGDRLVFNDHRPAPPPLSNFDTLKQAKEYLEYLKKETKIVYMTD